MVRLELAIMDIMIVRLFSGKYFGQTDRVSCIYEKNDGKIPRR